MIFFPFGGPGYRTVSKWVHFKTGFNDTLCKRNVNEVSDVMDVFKDTILGDTVGVTNSLVELRLS